MQTETAELKTAQHTPGPWKITFTKNNANENADFWACIGTRHESKASFDVMTPSAIHSQEAIANARLIAAAPELLEALKECVTEEGATAERSHAFALKRLAYITEVSRAAIARAEGRA